MRLLLGALALAVILGYVAGGRLRNVERLRLRWWWLAPVGLAMQLTPVPAHHHLGHLINVSLLIASYPVLLVFALANVRTAGFPLIVMGLLLNFIVIAANGTMPVSRHALSESHQEQALKGGLGTKHHLIRPGDSLTQLADVIPVGDPVDQVVSAGDIFVYAGVMWLVVAAMRGEPVLRRPRHSRAGARAAR